jgi:hypothetical protein
MKTYKAMKRAFIKEVRHELLQGVLQCSLAEQRKFKLMYATSQDQPIEDVVKKMPVKTLDWAMTQVQNTFNGRQLGQTVESFDYYDRPQTYHNQKVNTRDGKTGTWGDRKVVWSDGIWYEDIT